MAKSGKKMDEIELVDDAWPRFERFIKAVAKAGPQHRQPSGTKTKKSSEAGATSKRRTK
jgi:hypothetical protein